MTTINTKTLATVVSGSTALASVGFGLLNFATAGTPALILGAAAGVVALRSHQMQNRKVKITIEPPDPEPKQSLIWATDLSQQNQYSGRATSRYLISTLKSIDAVLCNPSYPSLLWYCGTTYSGVHTMIGSRSEFKVFDNHQKMIDMAYYFNSEIGYIEKTQEEIEELLPPKTNLRPSVIDFIADGGMDNQRTLPLGQLVLNEHRRSDLDSTKVKSRAWQLFAVDNGMYIAKRGTKNTTWRVFFDKKQFQRFFSGCLRREKRYYLPSEELAAYIQFVSELDSEEDLMDQFLSNVVDKPRGNKPCPDF